jgi:CDP-glucose 4,6-dehydratase
MVVGKCSLEVVVVKPDFWSGRRVLVTGHTGFKGSWLSLWLQSRKANVTGISLAPQTEPNLFDAADVGREMDSRFLDIRDSAAVAHVVAECDPEIVFHLAAQPLVRQSYEQPVQTFETNVLGTVYVLEALRNAPSLQAVVVVTSDKCYRNDESGRAFSETDALGGDDPYSASKGAAEIVAGSYATSYFRTRGVGVATVRAGNVIGGGDWSADRLVPDIVRATQRGHAVTLRYPHAVRPWQHVLEPLNGYIRIAEALASSRIYGGGWNFGPHEDERVTVGDLTQSMLDLLAPGTTWKTSSGEQPAEHVLLRLSTRKSREELGVVPNLAARDACDWTASWYSHWFAGTPARELTLAQITRYEELDASASLSRLSSAAH